MVQYCGIYKGKDHINCLLDLQFIEIILFSFYKVHFFMILYIQTYLLFCRRFHCLSSVEGNFVLNICRYFKQGLWLVVKPPSYPDLELPLTVLKVKLS